MKIAIFSDVTLHLNCPVFAVPFGVSSGFYTGLIGGGPVCLIWGFLLVGVLQECIAISLGEIQSQYPTSG